MKKKQIKILLTNLVTLLRTLGVLALIPVYLLYGGAATALLAICCFLTDLIDGQMARRLDASTFFGSLFDGVSDKLFLIANMILLTGMMPHAWLLILLELGIVGVQTLKYKNNLNIQSNLLGKAKMWVAGVAIVLTYLVVDPNLMDYAKNAIVANLFSKIKGIDLDHLFDWMAVFDVATLISYIEEFFKEKKYYQEHEAEIVKEQVRAKEELQQDIKDNDLKDILFDPEFYKKYKDNTNMMDMTKEVLTRKRVKK